MTKYYYHLKYKCYFAVVDNDFADVGIEEKDCKEVSKLEYDKSFIQQNARKHCHCRARRDNLSQQCTSVHCNKQTEV